MTPLKETLEVGEAPVSQGTSHPKPDSGQLRSDAVSLDVPVKVHGSRVVEVIRGTTPHTEPFEEQTSTMIVFPLGGVLKMTTPVNVGQPVVLTNLKTRQDAICRVIKVRTNPNLHSYVEVEFSHPQPGYWGVRFPSDGPELPKKAVPPAPSASSVVTASSPAPVSPAISIVPPRSEIKEHKNVSIAPAAPATMAPKVERFVEAEKRVRSAALQPSATTVEKSAAAPASPTASFSLEQLRGDKIAATIAPLSSTENVEDADGEGSEAHCEIESSSEHEVTFGRFAAGTVLSGERPGTHAAFGSRLDYSSLGAVPAEKGQGEGKNWVLIAASVALLFAVGGGGGFYFLHKRPAVQAVVVAPPAAPELPLTANEDPNSSAAVAAPVQQKIPVVTPRAATATGVPVTMAPVVHPREPESAKANKPEASEPAQSPVQSNEPPATKQRTTTAVPDMFGALNAHPTASVRGNTGQGEPAPSIESGTLAGGQSVALPSAEIAPPNLAPPPQPLSDGPVPVGGDVKAPQPISSAAPVYPEIARQAGVEGNVVVRIVIDKTGKVTEARAISGPMLLRDAGVSALRQRKYTPSKLNGRPISVEMLVTIQFRR
jgi:TonB family protein